MVKKIIVVVAVLLLVAGILISRDWDAPELGQTLLDRVGESTGMEMTASGFRFNLLHGVVLENVTAKASDAGRDWSFSLDSLVFEHRVMPLLSGTIAIDRIVLETPSFELIETDVPQEASKESPSEETGEGDTDTSAESAPASGSESSDSEGFVLAVEQILITDGTVILRKRDSDTGTTRLEGLDVQFLNVSFNPNVDSLAALAADGEISIRRTLLDAFEIRDAASRFGLADARFEMPELSFETDQGKFGANMNLDLNPVPFTYTLSAVGDPLDLNGMVGASEGFGPGHLEIDAEGFGSDSKDLKATGQLQLAAGKFPDVSMFSDVDQALGKQVLVGAPYEATRASVQVADNVVTLSPFEFAMERARLGLEGQVNLLGPIDLDFSVATPREGLEVEGVGGGVLDVLADDAGWVPVPIHVSGTLEEPRVRPDAGALMAQAGQGAKREAKEAVTGAATEAVKGLLGGRRKKN